jgi:hypothetical protein
LFAGLEKFTDFQVFVAAGSSLGKGPFSKSVAVKTLEDGGCMINDRVA